MRSSIEKRLEKIEQILANRKLNEEADKKGGDGKKAFTFIDFVVASSMALKKRTGK
ncbi:MAG: hypothetical protein ACREOW_10265 [Thermodesulfobacteriota bacterium]